MKDDFVYRAYYESPCGLIEVVASDKGIVLLDFVTSRSQNENIGRSISNCLHQLDEYFAKKRKSFSLPLDLQGTDFQKKVWNELLNIPHGKTISYLQLAKGLGDEKLIRAVGGANGKNRIAIVIPCHRVIGANGGLVGYAAGLDKKKWLLEFEGALVQQELFV